MIRGKHFIALALIILLTSCSNFMLINPRSTNWYTKEVLQCLDDGDEDALYDLFSEYTKNTEAELKEQIHNAVIFFKGDITEIDNISVGGSDAIDYGKIIYNRPSIHIFGIQTDCGNSYDMMINMYLINTEDETKEGLLLIKLKESDSEWDSDETIHIGKYPK
jgi:hypothetical protein